MFLLVPAYPGCTGSKAVKRSLLCIKSKLPLLSRFESTRLFRMAIMCKRDDIQKTSSAQCILTPPEKDRSTAIFLQHQQQPPFNGHYTQVNLHQLPPKDFVGGKFYCPHVPLLTATSAYGLRRRYWRSQQCYLHCLSTSNNDGCNTYHAQKNWLKKDKLIDRQTHGQRPTYSSQ